MADDIITQSVFASNLAAANQSSPSANSAVARCLDEWTRVFETEFVATGDRTLATYAAHKAYRNAMPPLCGNENIRGFVACVARGMLLGVFQGAECSKFLYAAQVALGAERHEPKPPKPAALPWPCSICRGADQFVPLPLPPTPPINSGP